MDKKEEKVRESNLELYRIVLMLLIIVHHYVVNSGLLQLIYNNPITGNSIFLGIIGAWGKIGINCFVLITGYFMYKSNISLKKFLKLLLQVEFYNVLFGLIFYFIGYNDFSIKDLLKSFIPIHDVNTNFVSCFLLFYLLIPYINILIKNMNKKVHLSLILTCLFIYTVLGTIPKISITFNYVTWFSIMYIIGAYISKYKIDKLKIKWNFMTIISIVLSIISVVIGLYISKNTGKQYMYYFIADSNKILAVIVSICMFMSFRNMKIKYNKYINYISSSIFGVLLIHANSDAMRSWLWKDTLNNIGMFNSNLLWLHCILSTIIIFILCVIIDKIRIRFIEKPFFKILDCKIEKVETKIKNFIKEVE